VHHGVTDYALTQENSKGLPPDSTRQRVHAYLGLLGLVMTGLIGLSLFLNLQSVEKRHRDLALTIGRSYHQAVVAMRQWNSVVGGLYVDSRKVQPNEYLTHLHRDVTTDTGAELTLVNPAYMTRLVGEFLTQYSEIQVKVTSRKPIRPQNISDVWETGALSRFEKGSREAFVVEATNRPLFRYMAPLHTQASCLECHVERGYAVGDLRGAISVSFPYDPFWASCVSERTQIWLNHGFFFLLGVVLVAFIGAMLVRSLKKNLISVARIRTLEGLLPICASCKRIRKEGAPSRKQESWVRLESFIQERTSAVFSHGMCPACLKEFYQRENLGPPDEPGLMEPSQKRKD
jgi:hypothetical protein